ncbi:Transcription cofactor vestigial-like protein 4 [Leptotrombidium deliense]|uniref:Transcription cofactor vestigial-like protein 4 n=1 Tax=Leptotrombidium deliense TaxID=299467 RepID=A0A443SMY9_9ACAR|nr:Transcription cofactor vestigial-like protein 4 [Leptotrombidium deliense]
MKRSKDRRELAHSSSFRLRRSISPHLIDERSNPESFEALQRLNSPFNANSYMKSLEVQGSYPLIVNDCRRERSSSSCSFAYRGSPFEINCPNGEIQLIRRNSDPHSSRYLGVPSDCCDDDQPLDMSKKSRTSSDSESQSLPRSEVSTPDTANNLQQQMRPSVITCAPSLRPKLTLSPSCQSCNLSSDMEKCSTSSSAELNGHNCNSDAGHRKQILSAVCDPVIDEHFRRSLGKEYSELFINNNNNANNSPSVSMSVDDHFAKALGDTWRKLQEKEKEVSHDDPANL